MKRIAFKMQLKPGCLAEYQKRHDAIWPSLATLIQKSGISDYDIFCDETTGTLFGVQYCSGTSSQSLGDNELVQEWWAYMSDIMETNSDFSPQTTPLTRVFHLD
ncbi:L-rhamnose mutarotase [Filimonas effusa]|uniref:L-rhamnose mutarotase n=1 Tax=Filimonas effusa TaxID=2508721 RepID=A0A4Q1DBP0_9BACT|nr:L-rhamnose mutarotase [Filimonas effusa]RXK86857.1 L-rhamnose mutarotase [Filimonas effusa]